MLFTITNVRKEESSYRLSVQSGEQTHNFNVDAWLLEVWANVYYADPSDMIGHQIEAPALRFVKDALLAEAVDRMHGSCYPLPTAQRFVDRVVEALWRGEVPSFHDWYPNDIQQMASEVFFEEDRVGEILRSVRNRSRFAVRIVVCEQDEVPEDQMVEISDAYIIFGINRDGVDTYIYFRPTDQPFLMKED